MKKTFPAVMLALACVPAIPVATHVQTFNKLSHSSFVLRPIPEKLELPRSLAKAASARAVAQVSQHPSARANSRERIAANLVSASAIFETARSNAKNGAQFIGRTNGMDVALTGDGIIVRVRTTGNDKDAPNTLGIHVKGTADLLWRGEDKAHAESNYFVGNDPRGWRTHVARFNRVETVDADGVTLALYGKGQTGSAAQGIEYDVRLDSGVDPAKVRLELSGARDVSVDYKGDLVMNVGGRELRMRAPAIYEQVSTVRLGAQRRRKMTSSPRSRKITSPHSKPRGSRGTRPPRAGSRGGSSPEHRRVRKSVRERSHSTRKKRPKRIPLPFGDNSMKSAAPKSKPPVSSPRETGRRIDGGYVLETDGSIGFWIGKHDSNAALLIDPSIAVTYSTFLGGTGADSVNGMAIDASGNVYVAGTTTSAAGFPEVPNGIEGNIRGTAQLFLAKVAFSTTGIGTLQYLTFFGGSNAQAGGEVAVDANGNAAVLGTTTSADYPVTDGRGPTQGLTGGTGNDLIVSEVDATGSNLVFSTIFGGNGTELASAASGIPPTSSLNIPAGQGGIAFDAAGNVYVSSDTTSTDLPTTSGAYQPAFGGKDSSDGFIAEFQTQDVPEGAMDLLYCSYLGTNSDGEVAIGGVAVDGATPPGVYIVGSTNNAIDGFPIRYALQSQYEGGPSDAFLMKMQLDGTAASDLLYSTLLGGSGMDEGLGVTVDSQGFAYVVGATQSLTFPGIPAPAIVGPSTKLYQPTPPPAPGLPPIQNAFLAVIGWSPGQTVSLQYFTYLGGSGQDAAESVAVTSPNSVYLSGTTTSYDFGWRDNVQPFNGRADSFIVKLDTGQTGAASLVYSTPLGGTFLTPDAAVATFGNAVVADGRGDVYAAGETTATNFPAAMTSGNRVNGFQQICGSCQESPAQSDAFLAGLQEGTTALPAVSFGVANVNFGSAGVQVGTEANPSQVFTIRNTGEANLTFSQPLAVTGPNSGDFQITASGCTPAIVLTPGSNCQVQIAFLPSIGGAEGAFVSVADNAPGSPQVIEVTGRGVGALTVSPASFAFGTVPLGDAPTKHDIKVTITAGVDVSNLTFMLSGQDSDQFVPEPLDHTVCASGIGTTLAAGSSCDIWYAFAPTMTGTFRAEIDLTADVGGTSLTEKFPLIGTAAPPTPIAIVLPSQLLFRGQPIGSTETLPVFISNTGAAPLTLGSLTFSGPNATEFSDAIDTADCTEQGTVSPGAECTVFVTFSPQTLGAKAAALVISDNAADSPQNVSITGMAISPPQAQPSSSALNFGSVSAGTQSGAMAITLTNAGGSALTFSQQIAISGANAADFSETNNCATAVPPGSFCSISVKFSPKSAGSETALLSIYDNAPNAPQTVTLAGFSTQQPQAQLSASTVDFESEPIGEESTPQTITVTSAGPGQPLTITSLQIANSSGSTRDFSETDDCGGPITASCAIHVTFTPMCAKESASRSATLTIQDNGSVPSQTVSLTGTAAGDFCLAASPDSLVETVAEGTTVVFPPAAATPFSIVSVGSFSGTVNLACSSSPAGPACTFSPSAAIPVSPNLQAQFQVQVATSVSSSGTGSGWPDAANWVTRLPWLALAAVGLIAVTRNRDRRAHRFVLAGAMFAVFCLALAACGGSGGAGSNASSDPPPSLAGSYTLTVTATGGAEPQILSLHLNVTP